MPRRKSNKRVVLENGVPVCYENGKRVPLSTCFEVDPFGSSGVEVNFSKMCRIRKDAQEALEKQIERSKTRWTIPPQKDDDE